MNFHLRGLRKFQASRNSPKSRFAFRNGQVTMRGTCHVEDKGVSPLKQNTVYRVEGCEFVQQENAFRRVSADGPSRSQNASHAVPLHLTRTNASSSVTL